MIGETYKLIELEKRCQFVFFSEGPKGVIPKLVLYEPTRNKRNQYNLGFGDLMDGQIDDSIVSNNNDLVKVMNAIAETVYLFSEQYPARTIYIKPVDSKRSDLYHAIFRRRQTEIEMTFYLKGLTEEEWESYQPEKRYLAFEISRKRK